MRLTELDPVWLIKDGKRVGFTFVSPVDTKCRQSCFVDPPPRREQWDLFEAHHGDEMVQGCKETAHWTIDGGIDNADFAHMTVKPSIDGSAGGTWHGHITAGEIVGGM